MEMLSAVLTVVTFVRCPIEEPAHVAEFLLYDRVLQAGDIILIVFRPSTFCLTRCPELFLIPQIDNELSQGLLCQIREFELRPEGFELDGLSLIRCRANGTLHVSR